MGWGRWADWKLFAVGVELAVAGTCVVLGWQLVHGHQSAQAATVHHAVVTPAPGSLAVPGLPPLSAGGTTPGSKRLGVAEILKRVNLDDGRLYRGQWATIQLLGRATRDYIERHVVPLLLAAARGGKP